ncbi:MAG TPA: ABC transporter permease [Polyangiaceae bacterium]|nr:ABC transporter permease [Polyangiaceae bacterium]
MIDRADAAGALRSPAEARPHPLWELTKARLREFGREKGTIFWVFGFPLLMAMALGLAFRSTPPERPRVAVVLPPALAADSPAARALRGLLDSPQLQTEQLSREQAQRDLARAKVDLLVEWDGDRPVYRFDPMQQRSALARALAADVQERALGRQDRLAIAEAPVSEHGARYIDFLLPGLIGMNLMSSSMWGIGYALVLARKRRLLRRFAVTPMKRSHFLLSYFLSRSFFLLLEMVVLLVFGRLVFGVEVRGSHALVLGVGFLGAASFAGLGLVIGARVENTEAASGWMNFVQLPMWLLSGTFFSYERFPEWLQGPARLLPLTALNDGLRGAFNDAGSLWDLRRSVAILAAWCGLTFVTSGRMFRWY